MVLDEDRKEAFVHCTLDTIPFYNWKFSRLDLSPILKSASENLQDLRSHHFKKGGKRLNSLFWPVSDSSLLCQWTGVSPIGLIN